MDLFHKAYIGKNTSEFFLLAIFLHYLLQIYKGNILISDANISHYIDKHEKYGVLLPITSIYFLLASLLNTVLDPI